MFDTVVKSLGTILEPEDLERASEGYALALASVERNAPEFAYLQPRRLRTRLAHIVIRLARGGTADGQALSEEAVSVLRSEAPAQAARKWPGASPQSETGGKSA